MGSIKKGDGRKLSIVKTKRKNECGDWAKIGNMRVHCYRAPNHIGDHMSRKTKVYNYGTVIKDVAYHVSWHNKKGDFG